jgi:hypothetical protein
MVSMCLWIPHINFWMLEPIFMKRGMYIMAPEPISTAYFINPSHQSVSVCVSLLSLPGKGSVKCIPPFSARQRLGNTFPPQRIQATSEELLGVCVWVCLCIPLLLLGNNSVKTFPRERKIVGGIVFYAVLVVSKESTRLVLPRVSCV